jgi:hypothetical protein
MEDVLSSSAEKDIRLAAKKLTGFKRRKTSDFIADSLDCWC